MKDPVGLICDMFNASALFLYHVPGRAWKLKCPQETDEKRFPYMTVRIASADTIGRDSHYHFEERIVELMLFASPDVDPEIDETLADVAEWITARMDSDHDEAIDPAGRMELVPVMPWIEEVNEDDSDADVFVMTSTFSLKTSRERQWNP